MKYTIKINRSGRYIEWCNENWYVTCKAPYFVFTKEECLDIYNVLDKHYVYEVTIIDEKGNEENLSRFGRVVKFGTSQNGIPKLLKIKSSIGKKSLFKFSLK